MESIEQFNHTLIDSVISLSSFNPIYFGKIFKNMTEILTLWYSKKNRQNVPKWTLIMLESYSYYMVQQEKEAPESIFNT